jgi:hypothetical protein
VDTCDSHDRRVAAQVPDTRRLEVPDVLCDYCKDFTDYATEAGTVRSAYRPGIGYAAEDKAASVQPREKEEAGLQIVERQSGAKPK